MRMRRRPSLLEQRLAEAQARLAQARSELADAQEASAALYAVQTDTAQALADLQEALLGQAVLADAGTAKSGSEGAK